MEHRNHALDLSVYQGEEFAFFDIWGHESFSEVLSIFEKGDDSSVHIHQSTYNCSCWEKPMLWYREIIGLYINIIVTFPPLSCELISSITIESPNLVLPSKDS